MDIQFLEEARRELGEAVDFYVSRDLRVARRFTARIRQTLDRAVRFPYCGLALRGDLRRLIIPGFPYGLLYRVRDNSLQIAALMHLQQDPERMRQVDDRGRD